MENHTGLETPLSWDKAIKSITLCLLIGIATLISGYALGETAEELISFFGEYDDDEKKEADDKHTGAKYITGTAAQFDLIYHTVIALLGWVVFTVVVIGSHIFHLVFWTLDDDFTCDILEGDYSAVDAIVETFTTKEKCLKDVGNAFKLLDKDGDGVISRCEDASYQVSHGSTKEYALKYSTTWTMGSAEKLCYSR